MARVEGDLAVMPLADLVIWVANRRLSGVLTVERETVHKVFTLSEGMAVRAASNNPREYFGQFLVHFGLLTEDQLQRAFDTQTETKVLLGRILVMIGIVPEEQVIQTLRVKISETMLEAFDWTSGRFSFVAQVPEERRPEIEVAVPLIDVHREGVLRADMWARFQQLFPDPRMILEVVEARVPSHATPDTLDGRILNLAEAGLNIEAITLEMHATDHQIAARLLELHQWGVIRPREPSVTALVPPELSRFDGGTSFLDMAKSALAESKFGAALRHVEEGAKREPHNSAFAALRAELEAKVRSPEHDALREAVPALTDQLTPSRTKQMSAKQRYVLARIDGKRTVQAIIQVSPMHDLEALEILRGFERERLIELRGVRR